MSAPANATAPAKADAGASKPFNPELENKLLSDYLYYVLGSLAVVMLIWRVWTWVSKYVRTVSSLQSDTQRYFAQTSPAASWFKREMRYAPVFRKRHNREFQLSSAVNMGTLPTRLQLVLLAGYVATNVAFCLINIPLHANFDSAASQLRNRTGVLAVVNMVPLWLLAGRNNPLINLLGISFDTMNLLHRWLARIVVLEAVTHTLAFMIPKSRKTGWEAVFGATFKSQFLMWGFIVSNRAALCVATERQCRILTEGQSHRELSPSSSCSFRLGARSAMLPMRPSSSSTSSAQLWPWLECGTTASLTSSRISSTCTLS